MSTEEKAILDVPCDVMQDIARIILRSDFEHLITDVNGERNSIKIKITVPSEKLKAWEDMKQIVDDYNYYRFGEEETF